MTIAKQRGLIGLSLLVFLVLSVLIAGGWYMYQWLDKTELVVSNQTGNTPKSVPTESTATVVTEVASKSVVPTMRVQPSEDAELAAEQAGFDLNQIGKAPWSDQEFHRLTALLQSNPEVIEFLALEYRISQDRGTLRRLAQLLGQFDATVITDVGVELTLSGEVVSQRSGLHLLGKQQPRVQRARDTIADVLSIESRPEVLTAALNAMAKPAATSTEEHRELLNRYTHLTKNSDPTVRALSVSVIAAWSNETDMSQVLLSALHDSDPMVRENAAFAFLKSRHLGEDAKIALFSRVEDDSEAKRTREAALYALQRFDLSEHDRARYQKGKLEVQRALNY